MFRTVDGAVVSGFLYQLWVETEVAGGEGVMCSGHLYGWVDLFKGIEYAGKGEATYLW